MASLVVHATLWLALGPLLVTFLSSIHAQESVMQTLTMRLTRQVAVAPHSPNFHRLSEDQDWESSRVAVIVCDVWDSHHCLQAVRRVHELAPRIDSFVASMRERGATIIHAPSDCMAFYTEHPARLRAQRVAVSSDLPADIQRWCDRIPIEADVPYPVDQSDGGEDDDPIEHAQWQAALTAMGRNPKTPWVRQTPDIAIDEQHDFVSDSGTEIWNILSDRKIEHVLLCGVHTNMCVLGRPFGLRQLRAHGKHAVLVRDLTDTMYNPARWPYVNHFSGTDAVIDYIERTVCETVTSDPILGGHAFQFKEDHRPHWVVWMAEDEYGTDKTLTEWSTIHLARDFRVSWVHGDPNDRARNPGLEVLDQADGLIVSVRRHPLPPEDMQRVRAFVNSGRPVLGIRTASHAFQVREGIADPGLVEWPEWDHDVFGGHYTNHHRDDLLTNVERLAGATHPLLGTLGKSQSKTNSLYTSRASLYRVRPLREGAHILWQGSVLDEPSEPVAWTFVREDSGRSFCTSLGHASDFDHHAFRALLLNAAHWLTGSEQRVSEIDIQSQLQAHVRGLGKQR